MKNLLITAFLAISTLAGFAQVKQPAGTSYESPLFRSIDGTYFDLEHDNSTLSANSYFNILDWLQGRVAGLQVYTIRGIRIPFIRNYPATVYVDEIRTDASVLNMIPVADLALVKIIKSPQAAIASGPGGAIVVYTKKGEGEVEEDN